MIEEYIKKGVVKAYRENLQLHSIFDSFTHRIREYFLTVHIAQQLLEWNKSESYQYKIFIEYPLKQFYENAFIPVKIEGDSILNQTIRQRSFEHSKTKKLSQQIDLVIAQEEHKLTIYNKSLIGIEIKGINKSKKYIINDIERLSRAMIETDEISDNSIEYCYSVFLRRFDSEKKVVREQYISDKSSQELKKWDKECETLKMEYPTLSFSTHMFAIEKVPVESIIQNYEENSDIAEIAYNTGAVVGYFVKIEHMK